MPDVTFTLYDTVPMGNVAAVETVLFQVAQGGDATHTEAFTNSRGAGTLPQGEAFSINNVGVVPAFNTALLADYQDLWRNSFLQIRIADTNYLQIPLYLAAKRAGWLGVGLQTAAANDAMIGLAGDGYDLPIPIIVPGGKAWRVRVVQGIALSAANLNVIITLTGVLTFGGAA